MFVAWTLAVLVLGQEGAPDSPAERGPVARVHTLELDADDARLALRDIDGDGRRDAIVVESSGPRIALQGEDGGFAATSPRFAWPSDHLAWCLADLDGDGTIELVTVGADGVVRRFGCTAEGFDAGRVVLESVCYLPHGVNRMAFVRDVDGDGRMDLALPGSGEYRIHVQADDGSFADALRIAFEVDVATDVGDPKALDSRFGQTVRVPWFRIEDVDGDGRDDLVSRTEERVDFHLARPELDAKPTWSLDLAALGEELPKRGDVDFDDLLSNVDLGVQFDIEELDGVAPRDLVLQLGNTVKVYLGGSVGGIDRSPDQVLRISGNLLGVLVRDTDGDDRADLQMLRGDRISLGRVLRWLILPGALDFEFFTYRNEGGAFSRTPTRRNTVALKIPRLLTLFDKVEALEEEFERQRAVPAQRLDLAGDGANDDVVDVQDGELVFFANCAPPIDEDLLRGLRDGDVEKALRDLVLDDLDRMEDGETKVIDVGDLDTWTYSPGAALRAARQGREPVLRVPLELPVSAAPSAEDDAASSEPGIVAIDLDGDGRGDAVVWQPREEGGWSIRLVVVAHGAVR